MIVNFSVWRKVLTLPWWWSWMLSFINLLFLPWEPKAIHQTAPVGPTNRTQRSCHSFEDFCFFNAASIFPFSIVIGWNVLIMGSIYFIFYFIFSNPLHVSPLAFHTSQMRRLSENLVKWAHQTWHENYWDFESTGSLLNTILYVLGFSSALNWYLILVLFETPSGPTWLKPNQVGSPQMRDNKNANLLMELGGTILLMRIIGGTHLKLMVGRPHN